MLYPLKFRSIFKPRIWGGRRLEQLYGKTLPPGVAVGESWELSGLPGDESVVLAGPLAGAKLGQLVQRFGQELLGQATLADGQFPLLIKLLDARENLSVQVHPNRAMVQRLGGTCRLKNECWFIVDAEPDACIWIGLADGVCRGCFASAVRSGDVAAMLHCQPVRAGQFYNLPAGTVHALGRGIVVAEVQTPSDTTYRVFDWNRVDAATGQPRTLHVAEALEAIEYSPPPKQADVVDRDDVARLVECENFTVDRRRPARGSRLAVGGAGRMVVWQVLKGCGRIDGEIACDFSPGELVLLPAGMARRQAVFTEPGELLEISVPDSVL